MEKAGCGQSEPTLNQEVTAEAYVAPKAAKALNAGKTFLRWLQISLQCRKFTETVLSSSRCLIEPIAQKPLVLSKNGRSKLSKTSNDFGPSQETTDDAHCVSQMKSTQRERRICPD